MDRQHMDNTWFLTSSVHLSFIYIAQNHNNIRLDLYIVTLYHKVKSLL